MSALTIVQEAFGRQSLPVPLAVFSSVDAGVIQMRTLMNQAGKSLGKRHTWQEMTVEGTFTTVATAVQTALPSDFGWFIPETMFDRTQDRQVAGPITQQQWQQDLSGPTATAIAYSFRVRGGSILFTPTPTAGDSVYYEYVSKNWAETSGGTALSAMTADTDVSLIDEELVTLDLIWRYRKAKGLDYSEEFRTLELELEKTIGRDGGSRILSIGKPTIRYYPNVPDGNFPSS